MVLVVSSSLVTKGKKHVIKEWSCVLGVFFCENLT